jgi:hypothetical protein
MVFEMKSKNTNVRFNYVVSTGLGFDQVCVTLMDFSPFSIARCSTFINVPVGTGAEYVAENFDIDVNDIEVRSTDTEE